jgi:DNA-binding Xre family transcriptional regulator
LPIPTIVGLVRGSTEMGNYMSQKKTKLAQILIKRGISQIELIEKIRETQGVNIEKYRMSKIVSGQITNYFTTTARAISNALELPIEDILEN